jgi:muramoyltetrapeptide carboxypeptidase
MSRTIRLVAPARKISKEELQPAFDVLKKNGYTVSYSELTFGNHHQYSGTEEERISDFQSALESGESDILLCVRGGYGTLRIIDRIDFSSLEKQPKLICGYSDITVLHNHLLARYNISSLHCSMPVNFNTNTPEALQSLMDAWNGNPLHYSVSSHPLNRDGNASGILFGGNLSLMYALQGSASFPDPKGKILFLEDLDEYLYHIDRMMLSLKRSGVLESISGLIVGGMTDMKDNAIPFGKSAEEIIREHVEEYHYPVCFGFPAGHQSDNRALWMGKELKLSVSGRAEIRF